MNLPDYKNIKIAFFDIDGTMIDIGSRKITPNMLETLSGLQRNGIKICIATGRPPAILPRFQGNGFLVIAQRGDDHLADALRVLQRELSEVVGHRADSGVLENHGNVG